MFLFLVLFTVPIHIFDLIPHPIPVPIQVPVPIPIPIDYSYCLFRVPIRYVPAPIAYC